MRKYINDIVDWLVIVIGSATLVVALLGGNDNLLIAPIVVSSIFVLCYIARAFVLFIFRRPLFDWHLINGNFLRKVCCLILLMPFALTGISMHFIDSPKELAYDETLYECGDKELPCAIKRKQESPNLFWSTYYHFIDPGNQHMTSTEKGRGWAGIIAILGVFLLNGLLVSSIVGWIDHRKEKWQKGDIRYKGLLKCKLFLKQKSHYIVIGGNDMAEGVVRQIFAKIESEKISPEPYILIQTSRDVESFRRELFSTLSVAQQRKVIIYYGDRSSKKDIDELYLCNAKEVYILGEQTRTDELEPYHDTINMQCFDLLTQVEVGNSRCKDVNVIKCYVMFEYQTSFAAFQMSNQQRLVATVDGAKKLSFIPFSPYENWAQTALIRGEVKTLDGDDITYSNIDEDGISYESDKIVHMIIVGMSKIGTAMAIETAHLAHFPNFVRDNSKRTKITFIDKNAREESDFFMGRFPDLFKLCKWTDVDGNVHNETVPECDEYEYFGKNFLDIEWKFRNGGVESKENRDFIKSCVENKNEIVTIAICLPWPHQGLAAALYLPKVAIQKANDIWVYQPQSGKLLLDINKEEKDTNIWTSATYRKLKPFGMINLGFDADLLENEAIKYCGNFHKAKDALVLQFKDEKDDDNTCYWDYWNRENVEAAVMSNIDLSIGKLWSIWSNIYQINTFGFKKRSLGNDFSKLDIPEIKKLFAEVEHNRWNVEKLLMGYKPLENHILDEDEVQSIKEYLQLATIPNGLNEKDIYYNWEEKCYKFREVKGFYKNGPMKVHPNICPFECLPMDDKNYDICFTLAMPFLSEKTQK